MLELIYPPGLRKRG